MTKRVTQLLARYIGFAMVALVTFVAGQEAVSEEVIMNAAVTIATGLVGFGGIIIDQLIHRAETGGVLKPAGEKK